ncbi:hypothetical protein [Stackebrandtia albiflava]|uniref:hypothetical protein n=1 Tax=Stackebrandtia albiflava TaxID=406432 RepID=UPI0031E67BB7
METVPADPGTTVDFTPTFANATESSARGLVIEVNLNRSFTVTTSYDNCVVSEEKFATCVLPTAEIPAGAAVSVDPATPFGIAVPSNIPGPMTSCAYCNHSILAVGEAAARAELAEFGGTETGNVLQLVTTETPDRAPYEGGNGTIDLQISANPLDLAANPVRVDGAEGEEVSFTVAISNNGPADMTGYVDGHLWFVVIEPATGMTFIDSDVCYATEDAGPWIDPTDWAEGAFACVGRELVAGRAQTATITASVQNASAATDGRIHARYFVNEWNDWSVLDGDLSNNIAMLALNTDTTDVSDDDDVAGPGDGSFPVTGVALSWWIGGGAAVLVAGVAGVVLMRRRAAVATW